MWIICLLSVASSESRGSVSHAQLVEMMSHFLKGQGHGPALSSDPELLPILQSVCGQVTQLRLDNAAVGVEKEKLMRNGTWWVEISVSILLDNVFQQWKVVLIWVVAAALRRHHLNVVNCCVLITDGRHPDQSHICVISEFITLQQEDAS